ncbi:MAG: hypothetical protein FWF53_07070 [Candidatus Azobacteroides sp.]|nr:hypothetical protein [Candidatus Azobacteroides sp.]
MEQTHIHLKYLINTKTKSIILTLLIFIFLCEHTQAQDTLPYRSFKSFHNDTIRYLDYNFTIRNDQYNDKTVGDLLQDLELPVVYVCNPIMQMSPKESKIYIVTMDLIIRLVGNINNDHDDSKDYYIRIGLKNAIGADDFVEALSCDKRNDGRNGLYYWTPQLYEVLKNFKLEGIEANNKLFAERRKILKNYSEENWKQLRKIIENEKAKWQKRIKAEKQSVNK